MEILIQPESRGIHYEGYENEYIQCVFEDGGVSGKNERYEFRCRPDLECCGRVCCIPQEATVPFWLMILFTVLALLLLCALLGTIAWLCGKRKTKQKPQMTTVANRRDIRQGVTNSGYRSMKQPSLDDRFSMENAYSTPADNLSPDWHGYGNPLYGNNRGLTATHEGMHGRRYYDRGSGLYDKAGGADRSEVIVPIEKRQTTTFQDTMNHRQHGSNSNLDDQLRLPLQSNGTLGGDYYHETFEEKFEEKYEIDERSASPSDSRELL